jgi:hypothetical protein
MTDLEIFRERDACTLNPDIKLNPDPSDGFSIYEDVVEYTVICFSSPTKFESFETVVDLLDAIAIMRNIAATASNIDDPFNVTGIDKFGCWRIEGGNGNVMTPIGKGNQYSLYEDFDVFGKAAQKFYNSYVNSEEIAKPIEIQSYFIMIHKYIMPPTQGFEIIMRDCETLFQLVKLKDLEAIRESPLLRRLPEKEVMMPRLEKAFSENDSVQVHTILISMLVFLVAQSSPFKRGSAAISEILAATLFRSVGLATKLCKFKVFKAMCSADLEAIFSYNMEDYVERFTSFLCEGYSNNAVVPCDSEDLGRYLKVRIEDLRPQDCRNRWSIAEFK